MELVDALITACSRPLTDEEDTALTANITGMYSQLEQIWQSCLNEDDAEEQFEKRTGYEVYYSGSFDNCQYAEACKEGNYIRMYNDGTIVEI